MMMGPWVTYGEHKCAPIVMTLNSSYFQRYPIWQMTNGKTEKEMD